MHMACGGGVLITLHAVAMRRLTWYLYKAGKGRDGLWPAHRHKAVKVVGGVGGGGRDVIYKEEPKIFSKLKTKDLNTIIRHSLLSCLLYSEVYLFDARAYGWAKEQTPREVELPCYVGC